MSHVNIQITVQYVDERVASKNGRLEMDKVERIVRDERINLTGDVSLIFDRAKAALDVLQGGAPV